MENSQENNFGEFNVKGCILQSMKCILHNPRGAHLYEHFSLGNSFTQRLHEIIIKPLNCCSWYLGHQKVENQRKL